MALPDIDSSVGHSFSLEIDGVQIAGITEVSGLALEQDVIEIKETAADGTVIIRKLPGRPKAGEVTLIRRLTARAELRELGQDSAVRPGDGPQDRVDQCLQC